MAQIIDSRILFEEERIETYFVDQTDPKTLEVLASKIPKRLDLVVDDEFHALHANLNTLLFGLKRLKIDGWVVIEDIPISVESFWTVVANLIPENFVSELLLANSCLVFAVRRVS